MHLPVNLYIHSVTLPLSNTPHSLPFFLSSLRTWWLSIRNHNFPSQSMNLDILHLILRLASFNYTLFADNESHLSIQPGITALNHYQPDVMILIICNSNNICTVRYHCGGRPMEINACFLNSYMVYL